MKKIFSIIMLAAAVSLVTLSACGDASAMLLEADDGSKKIVSNSTKKLRAKDSPFFFAYYFVMSVISSTKCLAFEYLSITHSTYLISTTIFLHRLGSNM